MSEFVTAHDPRDLAGALPAMFGFMPEHSLVAIATTGPRQRFGFRLRVDLPIPEQIDELATLIARHIDSQGADGIVMMGVGDSHEQVAAWSLMDEVNAQCKAAAVINLWIDSENQTVVDVNDPALEHFDLPTDHPAVTQAVAAGMSIVGSRDDLVQAYEHRTGELADAVFNHLLEHADDEPDADEAHTALAKVLNTSDTGPLAKSIATLTVAATSIEIRDAVWSTITQANACEMAAALRTAAVHAPEPLAHPLYALTAFADWMCGDGTRALISAEKALALNPGYSMAELIIAVLQAGINPKHWTGMPAA